MKKEEKGLKSGIKEYDNAVKKYCLGMIGLTELCDTLWNTGYSYGRKDTLREIKDNE